CRRRDPCGKGHARVVSRAAAIVIDDNCATAEGNTRGRGAERGRERVRARGQRRRVSQGVCHRVVSATATATAIATAPAAAAVAAAPAAPVIAEFDAQRACDRPALDLPEGQAPGRDDGGGRYR